MPRHGPSVRRQWVSFIAGWLVFVAFLVGLAAVAVLTSTPPRPIGPNPVPYVVTSGIGVAEIAYVSTSLALLAALPAVAIPMSQISGRRRGLS